MSFITALLEPFGMSTQRNRGEAAPKKVFVCGHRSPYNFGVRTHINESELAIFGWPSRGGVIVLEEADAIDFDYLGMDPLDPTLDSADDQSEEDLFCQRLLLLGAKWWDSAERYFFVRTVCRDQVESGHGDGSFRYIERPEPTLRETLWSKVGWPTTGGLWVSEFVLWGEHENASNALPEDGLLGRVRMARSMDERCSLIEKRLHGKFYKSVEEYDGEAFLTAWEWKRDGEAGPLLTPKQTLDEWRENLP